MCVLWSISSNLAMSKLKSNEQGEKESPTSEVLGFFLDVSISSFLK